MVLIVPIVFSITPIDGSFDTVINLSILQDFFICLKIFVVVWRKNSWEKVKKRILQYYHVDRKYCFVIFTALQCIPIWWRCKLAKARHLIFIKNYLGELWHSSMRSCCCWSQCQIKWHQILWSLNKTKQVRHIIYARSISR